MSASEKLKALDLQPFATVINDGDGRVAVAIDLDRWRLFQSVLSQIVAVVAEAEVAAVRRRGFLENDELREALAALDEALS